MLRITLQQFFYGKYVASFFCNNCAIIFITLLKVVLCVRFENVSIRVYFEKSYTHAPYSNQLYLLYYIWFLTNHVLNFKNKKYQNQINTFMDIKVFFSFKWSILCFSIVSYTLRHRHQYFKWNGFHRYMRGLKMAQRWLSDWNTVFFLFVLSSGPSHGIDHCRCL